MKLIKSMNIPQILNQKLPFFLKFSFYGLPNSSRKGQKNISTWTIFMTSIKINNLLIHIAYFHKYTIKHVKIHIKSTNQWKILFLTNSFWQDYLQLSLTVSYLLVQSWLKTYLFSLKDANNQFGKEFGMWRFLFLVTFSEHFYFNMHFIWSITTV